MFCGLQILSFSVTHAQFSVLNTYNRNISVATENRKHLQYLNLHVLLFLVHSLVENLKICISNHVGGEKPAQTK